MKTRIIALILTVVMALLALTSCSNSYDLATENLDAYAEFNLDKFLEALQNIEVEDGEFTTDDATREKLTAAQVYNTIVDKIVAATKEEEQLKSGELTAGDVLYFVYYAVDADKNEFFGTHMKPSTITDKSYAANHVIKLGDNFDKKGEEFFKLLYENLPEDLSQVKLEDYVFSSLTAAELQSKALEELLEKNPDATDAEKNTAKTDAIKLNAGDKVYIEYTRTYEKETEDGKTATVTEKASYTLVTLDAEDEFFKLFFADGAVANVGTKIAFGKNSSNKEITSTEVTIDGVKYTYKDVTVQAKVVNEGKPISTFEYTPYDVDKKEETPSSLYTTASKVNLGKKALTYYVYPVYAIDAPEFKDITAADILYHLNGSKLVKTSYKTFETEGYKNGDETLEDLLKDITLIFDSTAKDNDFYKEGTDLQKAQKAYDDAVKAGGSNPSTAQKEAITEASTALTDAKNAALKAVIAKIVACKSGDKTLGTELLKEYVDGTHHSLKTAYDTDIQQKVGKEVLDLIYESVTIKAYPEKLLKEFTEHVYESYEYDFYTGTSSDNKTSNYDKYDGDFDKYLKEKLGSDVDVAIDKEAKKHLDPILKIFVVAQKLNSKAVAEMPGYVEADIKAGLYRVDGEDDAEVNENLKDEAGKFLVNNAYMKEFKSESSSSSYNHYVSEYGQVNIRTALQFQKLFDYLTSVEHIENKDMESTDVKYTEEGTLAFRVLDYKIAVETEEDAKEEN